ncbi:insecticidal delta-endotoxin Cry8Ea1 family protein [Bacillus toyonensis]|uniref:insecticidal delta-endotoxin Cry8Ea1 family protein n=1 Tax=Bacillus toyonensis TaxID=155322 RepID=UPI0034668FBE
MNQYYANNKFEIINRSNIDYQQRYPLANAIGFELKQMDYRDWMNMCENEEAVESFSDASTAVRNALIIGTGIAWAILGVAAPLGSVVAGVLNVVIPYLWPEEAGESGTPQAQFSWDQLMTAAEELIDKNILEEVKREAIDQLRIVQSKLKDYQQAICNWRTNPDNDVYKEDVRREFDGAEDELKAAIIRFESNGYQLPLLSSYAQAANLHLLLLRDVVQYGESWGFSTTRVQQYYSNPSSIGNPGMLELLAKYTDYCVNWYNTGLNQQYQTGDWNKFNDFRREMTIVILDVVSLWPTYDPKLYPIVTKSEITRTVNTPLLGHSGNFIDLKIPISTAERNLVDIPRLFAWPYELLIEMNNSSKRATGCQHFRYNTLSDAILEGGFKGYHGDLKEYLRFNFTARHDNDVWRISTDYVPSNVPNDPSGHAYGWKFSFTKAPDQHLGYNYQFKKLSGLPCHNSPEPFDPCDPNGTPAIPNTSVPCDNMDLYSHQFSFFGAGGSLYKPELSYYSYGWTHISVDANNLLDVEKITQIPAVKAYEITGGASVIKGPGSTGGDLVKLTTNTLRQYMKINITAPSGERRYRVRIRYACDMDTTVEISMTGVYGSYTAPATTNDMSSLTYDKFRYLETVLYTYREFQDLQTLLSIYASGSTTGSFVIDKIEFIPITGSLTEYEATQSFENARKAVSALFTNARKNALRMDVTDYDVDQAANKVDCMSDDMFLKEKMMLRDQVKHAKRLSQARNLLNYGDFESPDWSNANGWKVSNSVMIQADQPISRGRYLNMPGARSIEFNNKLYPTYAYQKVEEAKLKPYTRYLVRGFVGSATELELFVTRYGKEVHDKMNIPFRSINTWNPTDSVSNRCGTGQVSAYTMPNDPCQTSTYVTNPSGIPLSSTNGWCEDKQYFVFPIDVGEIYPSADLGIGIGFKISSPEGRAQLDNIEIIEAQTLTGEALARVKKREQKWKREMEQECALTEKTVSAATQAVNALFTSPEHNRLKPTATMQDILNAEKKVNNIPYVQDPYFEEIPGMNAVIFQTLQSSVQTAFTLYNQRNVIRNGDFSSGLSNWHATAGANVQQRDGNPHVLVISQWDANVSQEVCVQPQHGYVLRVTARKEGSGKGYVTISDCTKANTETVNFTSDERSAIPQTTTSTRRSNPSSVCDNLSRYNESFGITPDMNTMNYATESEGTAFCSCGCNNTIHAPSTGYQAQAYQSKPSMPNMVGTSSSYTTKTIEMFPETNRIRIEMGETEGTFLVESIELICMED